MPHQTVSLTDVTIIGLIGQDEWDKAHKAADEFVAETDPRDERARNHFLQGWLGASVERSLRNPR